MRGNFRNWPVKAPEDGLEPVSISDRPSTRGKLHVSILSESVHAESGRLLEHRSDWVPGCFYAGMEDNDIRGFLDGAFAYGWNQPHQSHVRLGRMRWKGGIPKYGEQEIMRFIQRWDEIALPPFAELESCRLSISVEKGPETELRVVVYAVNHDWNPGSGGTARDSTSPPRRGEVWWNAPAHEASSWGLPGIGFASRVRSEADTDISPLAEACYRPGVDQLDFASPFLTRYVAQRVADGLPLLFLFKLADHQEDIPGTLLDLCSANHGDSRTAARRPCLEIQWIGPTQEEGQKHDIYLEHGRLQTLPRIQATPGQWIAASFFPEPGQASPVLEARDGRGNQAGAWRRVVAPFRTEGDWVELRSIAAVDPVALEAPFTAQLKDTWVTAGHPEEQPVTWTFVSPSGDDHLVRGSYCGDFTWQVEFVPGEVGPWRYRWNHELWLDHPASVEGRFDVVGGSLENVMHRVAALGEEIDAAWKGNYENRQLRLHRLRVQFSRLQRAAMSAETPEGFRSPDGRERRELFRRVRSALAKEDIPDPIPLEPHPRPWLRGKRARKGKIRPPEMLPRAAFRGLRRIARVLRRMTGVAGAR